MDSAEIYYEKAIESYQLAGYTLELANIEFAKAEIDLSLSDTLAAIQHYKTILNAPDEQSNLKYQVKAYEALAAIAENKKRYKDAFHYYSRYHQLEDSLKQETNTGLDLGFNEHAFVQMSIPFSIIELA